MMVKVTRPMCSKCVLLPFGGGGGVMKDGPDSGQLQTKTKTRTAHKVLKASYLFGVFGLRLP